MKEHSFRVNVALHGSQYIPSDEAELLTLGSSVISISGSADRVPNIFSYVLRFDDHFVSPLIRPAPLQMPQASVSFSFSCASLADAELPTGEPLFDVYLVGVLCTGGAA